MLTRIKQWLCLHRYDLADLSARDARGKVQCACRLCGKVNEADYGLALPGLFDRNSTPDAEGHCVDCNQPMADHVNGCPTYPPLGTPGVTCSAAAGMVRMPPQPPRWCDFVSEERRKVLASDGVAVSVNDQKKEGA